MKFIKINGTYYNTMYIRSVSVVRSNRLNYEAELHIDLEGCAGERIGFKSMEEAKELETSILRMVNSD